MKIFALTAVIASLLCGTAAATEPVFPFQVRSPVGAPVDLRLNIKNGNETRSYNLLVGAGTCGEISSAEKDRSDEIDICVETAPNGYILRTEWKLRGADWQFDTSWDAVVARGGFVDVGRIGGTRLRLEMK